MKASCLLTAVLILTFLSACQNRYRESAVTGQSTKPRQTSVTGITNGDSYQVARSEYDQNFQTRYGLLYLSTSEEPFSGRVLMVDSGESGEFVYSDEQWKDGRKHGKSSKWFTNGVKMYERNYKDGKWHGTVTRWWPNGQKMYVRGYTNGVRHGKEATWRSDGSPLSDADSAPSDVKVLSSEADENPAQLPSVSLPEIDGIESSLQSPPEVLEIENTVPVIDETPAISTESLDLLPPMDNIDPSPAIEENADSTEFNLPAVDDEGEAPELLPGDDQLPGLPVLPDTVEETEMLDDLPVATEQNAELPDLPALTDDSTEEMPDLPPLDGIGEGDELPGLPPLPGTADDGGLGDLPPLPPLP
jgi:hypothetical protein